MKNVKLLPFLNKIISIVKELIVKNSNDAQSPDEEDEQENEQEDHPG